jgi:preprotein translocase SecE subunit
MAFDIYKRGQGKYTRLYSAFAGILIVGLGGFQLYTKLQALDLGLWVETMVPVALFMILSVLVLWIVNRPTVADFMISAEGEMKKVSWSSKKEIAVSTFVVIVVVVGMAALLGVTDLGLQLFFAWLLGI